MKQMKKRAKWLLPLLALLLVLAGCQAVGGLDVNKALLGNLDVKSAEESVSFSLNAVPAAGISAEDRKIVDLINSLSLNVSHIKVQDDSNVSASGTLGFKEAQIPFELYVNEKTLALNVEGAKKPFYYSLEGYEDELSTLGLDTEKAAGMSKVLTSFIVKNLPNPSVISAAPVTETVYGEKLNLMKLHAEVTGEELPALLKSFLKSVSKDSEGLNELISGLYDYLLPVLKQEATTQMLSEMGLADVPLDNKEEVVAVLQDTVKLAVDAAILMYDTELNKLYEETPEIKTVLGKNTKLAVDLYVDSSMHVRKENVNLNVALPQEEGVPISSISFKAETQVWNINGPVKADPISVEDGLNVLETDLTPGVILGNFNPNSAVYGLLKNDLGITRKNEVIEPEYGIVTYKGQTAMVPLRYLAYLLDAGVEWDAASKTITVTDGVYGTTILLKPGSAVAVVDGVKVKLPQAVYFDQNGMGMVPLRAVAEALHAKVTVDEQGEITISRD